MSPAARSGLTIIELVVAIAILAIGVLALAGSTAVAWRASDEAAAVSEAAHVAGARLERLASGGCAAVAGGAVTGRRTRETWTASALSATSFDVADSVSFETSRGTRALVLRGIVRC